MFSSYYMTRSGRVYPNKVYPDDVPVVVISPEDREQVEGLIRGYCEEFGGDSYCPDGKHRRATDAMQAALREFANPTPPKPDEPTGLGAVVEDADGDKWVWLAQGADGAHWHRVGIPAMRANWHQITAVRVLSEGVS